MLDSSKYTDEQAVELLTTEWPLASNKELIVEVTNGSVEARTTLIQQVGDSALIIDGTSNSCVLQAIRDPVIHFSLTGKKGDAPKPWGILKFIVNWDDRGFYDRALQATKVIPRVLARMQSNPTTTSSFSVYRDLPELRPKPSFPIPLRPSSTTNPQSPSLSAPSVQPDTSDGGLFDDDRLRFLMALWLERRRPIDDIVRDHFPEFEMEPDFCLPAEARLDLIETLLDEDVTDVFLVLEEFYLGSQFIYSRVDVEARWNAVRERLKGLQELRSGSGLKGGRPSFGSGGFPARQSFNTEASLTWDDPELIRSEELVDPLEQGGILLENHFNRRFTDLFMDLVYDVRYRWMDPGFGQIFNPTLYFCKHGPSGSMDSMASSMPLFKDSSFDVGRRHLFDLKPLSTTQPDSTTGVGRPTLSPSGHSSRVHIPSKTPSLESQPLSPG